MIKKLEKRPAKAPTKSTPRTASGAGQPHHKNKIATITLAKPAIPPADRSIWPASIASVKPTVISPRTAAEIKILIKFPKVRKLYSAATIEKKMITYRPEIIFTHDFNDLNIYHQMHLILLNHLHRRYQDLLFPHTHLYLRQNLPE